MGPMAELRNFYYLKGGNTGNQQLRKGKGGRGKRSSHKPGARRDPSFLHYSDEITPALERVRKGEGGRRGAAERKALQGRRGVRLKPRRANSGGRSRGEEIKGKAR